MSTHEFRSAVEAADIDRALATLADDVVFHSPVAFKPFEGREAVSGVLRLVLQTFEDFRYEGEVADETTTMLIFRTRVGDKEIQGLDLLHHDADGLIDEFTVMVRPLSGAIALAEAMGPKVMAAGLKA
jgi:SnoaL-like domain